MQRRNRRGSKRPSAPIVCRPERLEKIGEEERKRQNVVTWKKEVDIRREEDEAAAAAEAEARAGSGEPGAKRARRD